MKKGNLFLGGLVFAAAVGVAGSIGGGLGQLGS